MEKIFKADALAPVTVTGNIGNDGTAGRDFHSTIMSQSEQVFHLLA